MKHNGFTLLIAAALVQAAACYTYAGVPVAELRPGVDVRAHLSAAAVDRPPPNANPPFRHRTMRMARAAELAPMTSAVLARFIVRASAPSMSPRSSTIWRVTSEPR